jgi:CHASE3 domain sensor protein
MYQEAYDLNNKRLAENPSTQKQFVKCELMKSLKLAQEMMKSCHEKTAQGIQKELESTPKDDPSYPYLEWFFLLEMYQAGHDEYKQKMEQFIKSTKDETMKTRFKDSYDLVTR